jgi:hypothetical protein
MAVVLIMAPGFFGLALFAGSPTAANAIIQQLNLPLIPDFTFAFIQGEKEISGDHNSRLENEDNVRSGRIVEVQWWLQENGGIVTVAKDRANTTLLGVEKGN